MLNGVICTVEVEVKFIRNCFEELHCSPWLLKRRAKRPHACARIFRLRLRLLYQYVGLRYNISSVYFRPVLPAYRLHMRVRVVSLVCMLKIFQSTSLANAGRHLNNNSFWSHVLFSVEAHHTPSSSYRPSTGGLTYDIAWYLFALSSKSFVFY